MSKIYGVNLAGGEFGGNTLPGTLHQDYEYPHEEQYAYYSRKNIKYARLPFKPERIQRWPGGDLDAYKLSALFQTLDLAQKYGVSVLLEPHSFGRWHEMAYNASADDQRLLVDFVTKLVSVTTQHPAVWGYELIGNEPHDLDGDPMTTWTLTKACATAARLKTNKLLAWAAPKWQSSRELPNQGTGFSWLNDTNSCVSVHVYGDADFSGAYNQPYAQTVDNWTNQPVTATTMADRLTPAITWAAARKVNLIVTEAGVPREPEWVAMLDTMLAKVNTTANVLGCFLWAGGPWWGDYKLSTEPNADGSDKPQVQAMLKYV